MAVPKRRHSKQRTAKRKANWKLTATNLVNCPNCVAKMIPHRVCEACGYYKDNQVVDVEE